MGKFKSLLPLQSLVLHQPHRLFKANESDRDFDENYSKILVENEFEKQNTWVRNALMQLFDNKIPDKGEMITYLIQNQLHNKKHPGIGNSTVKKVDEFLRNAIHIYCKVENKKISPNEAESLKWNLITGEKIDDPAILDKISKQEMPLISFTAKYLREILNLNEVEVFIVKNHFGLLNKTYTVSEIAELYFLQENRVRIIRQKVIKIAKKKLSKLSYLNRYSEYEDIFKDKVLIRIPEDISNKMIKDEIEETGVMFSAFILSVLFESSHYLLSPSNKYKVPDKINFRKRYQALKQANWMYFIKKQILSPHEMLNIYNHLLAVLSVRHRQELHIKISSLVKYPIDVQTTETIASVFIKEFGISVHDNCFIIPRDTRKPLSEYAEMALEYIGKRAHITYIIATIKAKHPDLKFSDYSLRHTITKQKSIFLSFGHSGIFALKSWGNKYQNIGTGSISDIAEEFLGTRHEPCHISEVATYVRKFRKTKTPSVKSNLKINYKKRFVLFEEGYIGLASKKYTKKEGAKNIIN